MLVVYFLMVSNVLAANQSLIGTEEQQEKYEDFRNLIGRIVEEMGDRVQCFVVISDSYYSDVAKIFTTRILRYFPMYQVYVRDSDVFSPPKESFQSVMTESKKDGCNGYIILMANGIQVLKLLQYSENERIIDTRGYFLLMHDFRILRAEMSYLWNRITNVVFMRKYFVTRNKNDLQLTREWFHLETVYFPSRVDKYVLTKHLDTWYKGKFRNDGDLFFPKTLNLEQRKLKIAVLEHVPAVIKGALDIYDDANKHEALGIEFELMLYIAKAMNFEPVFYKPVDADSEKWGEMDNESYTGLIGEAVKGRASFYLGDLHNTLSYHRLLDLSYPYNVECMTFLTPESLTDNSWKLLILPFRLYTWIMVISTFLLGSVIVHFFSLFYKKYIILRRVAIEPITKGLTKKMSVAKVSRNREEMKKATEGLYLFTEVQNSALYIYSMLFQVSLPMIPRAWAVRVFIGCWWLYSILITVAYKASLTAALANPVQRKTIDTMAELAKTSIGVGGWGEETKEFLRSVNDSSVQIIGNRFEVVQDEMKGISRVSEGRFCYYENVYFLRQIRVKKQVLETEEEDEELREDMLENRDLHVMQDCLINMPVSLGLDKNSPLKSQVDRLVKQAVQVGLIEKWLSDVMEWSKITEIRHDSKVSPKAVVNFRKFQGALVVLALGYAVGILAFICELIHWRYFVLRNPNFNKYHLDTFYKSKY